MIVGYERVSSSSQSLLRQEYLLNGTYVSEDPTEDSSIKFYGIFERKK